MSLPVGRTVPHLPNAAIYSITPEEQAAARRIVAQLTQRAVEKGELTEDLSAATAGRVMMMLGLLPHQQADDFKVDSFRAWCT